MKNILFASLVILMSCAHSPERTPAQEQGSDLTIWTLQKMAQDKKFDELNDLFNNRGIQLTDLPRGYAAGTGARVLAANGPLGKLLDGITGVKWRGKIFFPSNNPRKSQGLNRITEGVLLLGTITPMASFVTELVDHDPVLIPETKSNFVTLNYAHPMTKGYWVEPILTKIQVYDVMVAVPGKYGPVFIGKTWLGKYDKDDVFHANDPKKLIAWFFLDFNAEALKVQQEEHWDDSKEKRLEPIPEMKY